MTVRSPPRKNHVAHLDRAQPVDVEMGQQVVAKIERQIGDILDVVAGVAGASSPGLSPGPGRGDAAQSRGHAGQVPHDIDVMLKQAQVDAHAVDVPQVSQPSS